jgi:hypothetical protein
MSKKNDVSKSFVKMRRDRLGWALLLFACFLRLGTFLVGLAEAFLFRLSRVMACAKSNAFTTHRPNNLALTLTHTLSLPAFYPQAEKSHHTTTTRSKPTPSCLPPRCP